MIENNVSPYVSIACVCDLLKESVIVLNAHIQKYLHEDNELLTFRRRNKSSTSMLHKKNSPAKQL